MTETVLISKQCPLCGLDNGVEMPREACERWEAGELIQVAWPQATPAEREVLISGSHDDCFNDAFPEED